MERLKKLIAGWRKSRKVGKRRKKAKDKSWRAYLKDRAAFRSRRKITRGRWLKVKAQRKKLATTPQEKAIKWAAANVGTTESPAGSNRGPKVSAWQRSFGSWLVGAPWCGVYVGCALRAAGVTSVTSRVASVAFIEDDAIAGRYGFKSWHGATAGAPGDAVVLFARGVHVELIESKQPWGYYTIGGNTSAEGSTGSQSNGGMVARRKRPFSQVRGCARPRY